MSLKPIEFIKDTHHGELFPSENSDIAMIVVTGSDGGIKWAREISKVFCNNGLSCLALAYWKKRGLPKTLSLIPIEIISDAITYLKNKGYSKVGIYGFSKGAELALIATSYFPQVDFVIAVSPSCCVFAGIEKNTYSKNSSWSHNGQPIPHISFDGIKTNYIKNFIKNRELGFAEHYSEIISKQKNEENTIKVENINAPILLLSAENDALWCSKQMGEHIIKRLQEKEFKYTYRHIVFPYASHILCPIKPKRRLAFKIERKYMKECNASRKNALKITLNWLSELQIL